MQAVSASGDWHAGRAGGWWRQEGGRSSDTVPRQIGPENTKGVRKVRQDDR